MSEVSEDAVTVEPAVDLLAVSPQTAYFWGRVAGDGEVSEDSITVRTNDERAADALAAIAGIDRTEDDHRVAARESAHNASIVRFEDEFEVQVFGSVGDRASAALGLPLDGQPGGYRFDTVEEYRPQLVRGLLEACGTVCFRESSGSVGVSFVHDDDALLTTIQSLLAASEPTVPTEDLSETSGGGYWFGLADAAGGSGAVDGGKRADVAGFAEWVYDGSDRSGLFSTERRQKLRRSVERATDRGVGDLAQ